MKKVKIVPFIFIFTALCFMFCPVRGLAIGSMNSPPYGGSTPDEIQKGAIVTLLYPKIEEAVNDYYKKYFEYIPHTAPYFVEYVSVIGEKRTPDLVNYSSYKAIVQVSPYLGAHWPVGTDRITLHIGLLGEVQVESFEHIQSFELPWNLQDSAKDKWPPK